MVRFTGRSHDIITIPSKPIPTGYKGWAVAQKGFILSWLWHSKGSGPVGIKKIPKVLRKNKTAATVPHLLDLLPKRPRDSPYIVWLDNLFSSTKLFEYLRDQGYGATSTARINSGICADFVAKKQVDQKKDNILWGTLFSEPTLSNQVAQSAWKDNALVLFLSTTHETGPDQVVIQHRKRPATTSTSAKTARKAFGSEPEKDLPIPKFVDDYNHYMGYVDQADQLRATNPGLRPIQKGGWHALWNFIFNVTLVNSFLLSKYKESRRFRVDLQKALLERSVQMPVKRPQIAPVPAPPLVLAKRLYTAKTIPDQEQQHHELVSGLPQRYCSICTDPPSRKRKREVLGEISSNSKSTDAQKRRKTRFGCIKCGIATCKDNGCFEKHCNTTNLS